MSTLSTHSSYQPPHFTTARKEHSSIQTKLNRKEYKNSSEITKGGKQHTLTAEASLNSISAALQDIAKRLSKLEGKEKRSRLPNRS
jgi:ribosome-associated translation inhibitor RaiA